MNTKRILSLILSLCMTLTMATFPVMAEESTVEHLYHEEPVFEEITVEEIILEEPASEDVNTEETISEETPEDMHYEAPVLEETAEAITTYASSGTCGTNLTWTLDDNGTLTISGAGAMTNYFLGKAPWSDNISSIKKVIIGSGVTSIGDSAFINCDSLTSVTIGNNVTSIGSYAFYYCSSLASITIGNSVTSIGNSAFSGCTSLTSVTIPNSVTTIGNDAFYNCSSLTSITIPDSVTSIGNYAFYGCSKLTDVYYIGTETQKQQISIGSDNSYLTNATWHYVEMGTCGTNVTWTLDSNGTLTIFGIGAMTNYSSSSAPWHSNRSSIKKVVIGSGVTSIGNYAFRGCTSLTSITIPDSVTTIGNYAFLACSSLTDVYYGGTEEQKAEISIGSNNSYLTDATWHFNLCGEGNHTYTNACDKTCNSCDFVRETRHVYDNDADTICNECGSERPISSPVADFEYTIENGKVTITGYIGQEPEIIIPSEIEGYPVTKIGSNAFVFYNSTLKSVVILDSVTSIGDWAFSSCYNLTEINVDNNNPNYTSTDGVLFNKNKTTLITYPAGKVATTYTIPSTVKTIGKGAFSDCVNLTDITIPYGVTSIEQNVFSDCDKLTNITISDSVTEISDYAFQGCDSLVSITVDKDNNYYCSEDGVLIEKDKMTLVYYPEGRKETTYTIPDVVESIDWDAFSCDNLTSIVIPKSVTNIDSNSIRSNSSIASITVVEENEYYSSQDGVLFNKDKTKLEKYPIGKTATTYTIPDSVTSIGNYAFEDCYSLTSITLPDSVTSIGITAFFSCRALARVNIPQGVTTIPHQAFTYCESLTSITIPDGVTKIGHRAFEACTSLTSVTLPNSVVSIDNSAFGYGDALEEVHYSGTKADRDDINIGNQNDELINATWYYALCGDGLEHKYDDDCDKSCNVCGETRIAPHNYDNVCDSDCNKCGEIRKAPHNYDDDCDEGCTLCGQETTVVPYGLQYSIENGEATITGYTGYATKLVIPTEIEGYPVTKIDSLGYSGSFTSITIPSSVTSIDDKAFTSCGSLVSIDVNENNRFFSSQDGILFSKDKTILLQYPRKKEGSTYAIPNSVTEIGYDAFYGCASLTSVTIPDSVTEIGSQAFFNCNSLTSITIPGSVTSIGSSAFIYCHSLTSINVDDGNNCFVSQDGILFSKDKTTIVVYPVGKTATTYTIPEGVTTIGGGAFASSKTLTNVILPDGMTTIGEDAFFNCPALDSIVIPDGVTSIGPWAFNWCSSLESITIPNSITSIGDTAFAVCDSLQDVYYIGTKEQKNSIVIEEYNTDLLDATWHYFDNACDTTCSDCDLTREATDHTYDNACDASCNLCGETRTITHTYTNECDVDCNICGTTRTVGDHVYTDGIDTDCNECGEIRAVPTFVVSNATAKVGNTFSVDVSIKNNSGIVGLRTYIGYDSNVLELVSATAGEDFVDTSFGPTTKNPFNIVWDDSLATESNTTNGVVATLTFKVKEGVKACDTAITLTYDPDDIYDYNLDNVGFATENGTITVFEYIPGDANGDGDVNNKDLGILRRWLNDWDVEIDELASDVNRDGKVNNKDMGILRRYLNDWDVELK